jgi:hypothetical protein
VLISSVEEATDWTLVEAWPDAVATVLESCCVVSAVRVSGRRQLARGGRDGADDVADHGLEIARELRQQGFAFGRGLGILLLAVLLRGADEILAEAFDRAGHRADLVEALGMRNGDVVAPVAHLVHGAGKLGEQLAQGAQHQPAQPDHDDQRRHADAEIEEDVALGDTQHLFTLGAHRGDGRIQDIPHDGREVAVDLEPSPPLRLRGRRAGNRKGDLAQLRELTPIGRIECVERLDGLRRGDIAKQLAERQMQRDAAREQRERCRR